MSQTTSRETTSSAKQSNNEHQEILHETTLFAEPIFHFKHFTVTNSLFVSWAVVLLIIAISIFIKKKIRKIPRRTQNITEVVIEKALELCDSVTNSRKKSLKIFPLVFAFFIFILLNNWFGLLPGVGSIGFIEGHDGHSMFIPFLRGGTADLNTTLALSLIAIIATHLFGVVTIGLWSHINKFINIKVLLAVPKKIIKDPSILLVNPIKFFVGIVEIIGEIAKVASLSFRLFGNIFAGEVLLISMAAICSFVLPIPFIFLEIIVGLIQALIFAMLTLVFATISMSEGH
ncbi:MAG: FoF1 ATP synthase subunit a [Patescibacteria group bacterium]|nr:FoF1 ATP synthase subunit a [Patescibacteria group bacterium]